MLNTAQFFSSLVSQYVNRYNQIAARFGAPISESAQSAQSIQNSPTSSAAQSLGAPVSETALSSPREDRASLAEAPTLEAPASDISRAKLDRFDAQNLAPKLGESSDSLLVGPGDSENSSEPATYSSSFTNLRYGLKLKFDMQAIQQTVHQLSSTQVGDRITTDESFEQLFSGGFGLNADLKLSGISVNTSATSGAQGTEKYRRSEHSHHGRALQQQAEHSKKSVPAEARQNYQVAVNRISLRYKSDTQFSFSHFSRFQSHVEQLSGSNPESVGAYSDQVGALAQGAPNNVVGQFFDTVDGYLEAKEANLIENAERFFDIAAESLGLSAEAVAAAKASVTDRIESFFDSVESNLNGLESSFNQPALSQPEISQPEPIVENSSIENSSAIKPVQVTLDGSNLSVLAQSPDEEKHTMLSDLISAIHDDDENNDSGLAEDFTEVRDVKEELEPRGGASSN